MSPRLLMAAAVAFWCALPGIGLSQEEAPRPAKVFTVEEAPSVLVRQYPGLVLPSREVELSFQVSGRVTELPIRAAVQVEEGDLIAALDPRDFETQIAQLQSQIDQAEANLSALRTGARSEEVAALEAAVASAQAQVDQALETAERTRQLAERGVVSQAQLDNDEATLRVAEANLTAQEEQLEIGLAGGRPEEIEAAEAAIRGLEAQLQVAENNLEYASLRAPFSGIIARRDIDNFSIIQAGQPVALLQALATIHMSFNVPAPDVIALSTGGPNQIRNQVTFDALPGQVFDGETVEFFVQADAGTQTYQGRIAVEVPQGSVILPGMAGRVIASTEGDTTQMMIPLTAVAATANGDPFVWVVGADNTTSARDVDLGEASGAQVAVLGGIEPGEVIVAAGVGHILEGMTVRPVTQIGG